MHISLPVGLPEMGAKAAVLGGNFNACYILFEAEASFEASDLIVDFEK